MMSSIRIIWAITWKAEAFFETIPDLVAHYQKFPVIVGVSQLLGMACDRELSGIHCMVITYIIAYYVLFAETVLGTNDLDQNITFRKVLYVTNQIYACVKLYGVATFTVEHNLMHALKCEHTT